MTPLRAGLMGAVLGFGLACTVALTDDLLYTCTSDEDCGGEGYGCTAPPGGAGRCCKPDGAEVCNGRDDDCNGRIDDTSAAERCNGLDDNCDGQTDEGFDLLADPTNCGACGRLCTGLQVCTRGACGLPPETSCSDGVDNDGNGQTDCADTSCNSRSCGQGCQCQAGRAAEVNCVDGLDNNDAGGLDCADVSCAGAGCFDGGCTCIDGGARETGCADGQDNDRNGRTDCDDEACQGRRCRAAPSNFTCAAGRACRCFGAVAGPAEEGPLCWDRVDNDCDGLTDCQQAACATSSCARDGGVSCRCQGGEARERDCADRRDNDDDGSTDCADAQDCPAGTPCTFLTLAGTVDAGSCAADRLCR